jgi:DNA-binding PadR family transcriptional regulator
MTIPDYMIMCLEITANECNPRNNADIYWELIKLNNDKFIASNRHRQEHGHVDKFWLTKKGLKEFNKVINA